MTPVNRLVLKNGKDRQVQQAVYFYNGAVEIVTRDTSGREIRIRHNLGGNLNGFGSTRVVQEGTRPLKKGPAI